MTPAAHAASDDERSAWQDAHREASRALSARIAGAFERLLAALDDAPLDGTGLTARASPGAWSTLEVLEHVALANHYLLLLVQKIVERSRSRLARGAPWPAGPPEPERLAVWAAARGTWTSPAHMLPNGALEPAELRARLVEQRDSMLAHLSEMPAGEGTLHRIRMSVLPGDESLDLYGMLDFVTHHAERHVMQIERSRGGRGT